MAETFAVLFAVLFVAHSVADHWVQTSHQSAHKSLRDFRGSLACLRHVGTYTATTALFAGTAWVLFDLDVNWLGFVLGQFTSAVTHYWADRRFTLTWLADRIGKGGFSRSGEGVGSGAYVLDQSFHHLWLLVAAMVTTLI